MRGTTHPLSRIPAGMLPVLHGCSMDRLPAG
jgi:hypothetical protein